MKGRLSPLLNPAPKWPANSSGRRLEKAAIQRLPHQGDRRPLHNFKEQTWKQRNLAMKFLEQSRKSRLKFL
jgi:hypothetical protein